IAGNGTPGNDNASLAVPTAVAVDGAGNVYIADTFNHRIQKVAAGTGTVTMFAGTGTQGQGGDGAVATTSALAYPYGVAVNASGTVYISDTNNHRVRQVIGGQIFTLVGAVGAAGCDNTHLNLPRGLAVSSGGDVFIADGGNHRVTKVTGTTMTLFAGATDCSA